MRRDTQPFVLKPEDLSVRAMVPSELISLGFSLATSALIFNRTFADKLASFKISEVNQQLVD